jgi:hypothetical protein
MSVRAELEELVKWLSELTAEDEQALETTTLPREDWQVIHGDLREVSEKLGWARRALPAQGKGIVAAELAGDVERQAEGLQFRAHVLSRRAPPKPKELEKLKKPPAGIRSVAGDEPSVAAAGGKGAAASGDHGQANAEQKEETEAPTPAALVKSASVKIEHSRRELDGLKDPDAVTQAFEDELDVLAEMTLSLRQLCERVAEEAPAAAENQKAAAGAAPEEPPAAHRRPGQPPAQNEPPDEIPGQPEPDRPKEPR